jgi:hypothetical protein
MGLVAAARVIEGACALWTIVPFARNSVTRLLGKAAIVVCLRGSGHRVQQSNGRAFCPRKDRKRADLEAENVQPFCRCVVDNKK